MISLTQIESDLLHFIQNNILSPDTQLNENSILKDAGVDSFSLVEVILFIERKYGLELPEEVVHPDNFKSVKILATIVYQLLQKQ
jgi:acyl carrier protein